MERQNGRKHRARQQNPYTAVPRRPGNGKKRRTRHKKSNVVKLAALGRIPGVKIWLKSSGLPKGSESASDKKTTKTGGELVIGRRRSRRPVPAARVSTTLLKHNR